MVVEFWAKVSGYKKLAVTLAALAGIIYNFWILGFFLDPEALHGSYFSALEAYQRPYSWAFIMADVAVALLVFTVGWLVWRVNEASSKILAVYTLFGLATLLDAVVPITDRCSTSISACGIAPSQVLSFHDLASLVAFLSVFYCLKECRKFARSQKLNRKMAQLTNYAFFLWCITGLFLGLSVIVDHFTTISQGLFYGAIGLGLAIIPTVSLELRYFSDDLRQPAHSRS